MLERIFSITLTALSRSLSTLLPNTTKGYESASPSGIPACNKNSFRQFFRSSNVSLMVTEHCCKNRISRLKTHHQIPKYNSLHRDKKKYLVTETFLVLF